jgi:hypothetical protein
MEKHTDVPKDKEIKIDADDNVLWGNIVFIKPLLAQIGICKKTLKSEDINAQEK